MTYAFYITLKIKENTNTLILIIVATILFTTLWTQIIVTRIEINYEHNSCLNLLYTADNIYT